jgi:DNA-binding transcriptional regulator/RsmH inhibitor MraZ
LNNFDAKDDDDKYNYQNGSSINNPNIDLSQLMNMFPQLKNMDQDNLLKLLQNNKNNVSMDSESRVIYTQTIQSFYKDSTKDNINKSNTIELDNKNNTQNEFFNNSE